jgi:ribosome-associated protein
MPRKPRRGYYVEGQFVAPGSEADARLNAGRYGPDAPSRTARKVASEELQALGEALVALRADRFAALPIPERLREAVVELKRLSAFEAIRRQRQFLGKLMRDLDPEELAAIEAALAADRRDAAAETARHHRAEQWRDELIAGDAPVADWLARFPATDARALRTLVRQARQEAAAATPAPGGAPRHGPAYRKLYALVRAGLDAAGD